MQENKSPEELKKESLDRFNALLGLYVSKFDPKELEDFLGSVSVALIRGSNNGSYLENLSKVLCGEDINKTGPVSETCLPKTQISIDVYKPENKRLTPALKKHLKETEEAVRTLGGVASAKDIVEL